MGGLAGGSAQVGGVYPGGVCPGGVCLGGGVCCGQYASYLNVFLFFKIFLENLEDIVMSGSLLSRSI